MIEHYQRQQDELLVYESVKDWRLDDLQTCWDYYEEQIDRYIGELLLLEAERILDLI